jgi:hypothetical protein
MVDTRALLLFLVSPLLRLEYFVHHNWQELLAVEQCSQTLSLST